MIKYILIHTQKFFIGRENIKKLAYLWIQTAILLADSAGQQHHPTKIICLYSA